MEQIIQTLMQRDGIDRESATEIVSVVRGEAKEKIASGAGLVEIEEFVQQELGLEPDYIMDIIC